MEMNLDETFLSRKELALVYDAVDFYNRRALQGADASVARIVTYKMAKTLSMRLSYPKDAAAAFDFVRRIASWLALHSVSLEGEDRVSLVSFYIERLTFNLSGDMRSLVMKDSRFVADFGDWDAVRLFVRSCLSGGGAAHEA